MVKTPSTKKQSRTTRATKTKTPDQKSGGKPRSKSFTGKGLLVTNNKQSISKAGTPKDSFKKRNSKTKHDDPRSKHFQQIAGWQVIDVSDGIAIHDPEFQRVHYLNHTAAAIYLLCKQPITIQEICTILKEEFELESDPKDDVQQLIDDMAKMTIVQEIMAPGKVKSPGKNKGTAKSHR